MAFIPIHGITVTLVSEVQTGYNALHEPVYEPSREDVENVIVGQATEQDVADTLNLYGRRAVYTLCIPKGDAHDWENQTVEFFGKAWRTIGHPIEYIEDMVPLAWNKKVRVESRVEE